MQKLVRAGATMTVYDPVAMDETKRVLTLDFADAPHLLSQIQFAVDANSALQEADALIIVTEWKEFKQASLQDIQAKLKQAIVFDGRNLYDPAQVRKLGIEDHAIGRAVLTKNTV
jgi:UDPglucose 6-dehydrogenase